MSGRVAALVLLGALAACDAETSSRTASPLLATRWADAPVPARRAAVRSAAEALTGTLSAAEAADLASLYARAEDAVIWLSDKARPVPVADRAMALLQNAASEGLRPADYRSQEVNTLFSALRDGSGTLDDVAHADVLLSSSVLGYLRHLHLGRVDPRTLGLQLTAPEDEHDFAALVLSGVASGKLDEAAASLAPAFAQYSALKDALTRYRALAALPEGNSLGWSVTVHRGEPFSGVVELHRRLVTLGDLPADTPVPGTNSFDDVLSGGVMAFQRRHGLDPDGTLGPATAAELDVPLTWRVRQIELALERLRWLPDLRQGRVIVVNIPMFRLWAWRRVPSTDPPVVDMAVIVGRALDTRTPVFAEPMRFIVFRPYWNVPTSILRNEILPALRNDAAYLDKEDLELVRGQSDSSPLLEPTGDHLAELVDGTVRVRQRPGPSNALGLVKFMLPNQNDVYLHGTPAPELFRPARRDFSHGCIRVEDPVTLAAWLLAPDGWSRDEVVAAMHGQPNVRIDLAEPVQVVIFYTTVAVMPDDNRVHFAADLYGQDRLLDEAW